MTILENPPSHMDVELFLDEVNSSCSFILNSVAPSTVKLNKSKAEPWLNEDIEALRQSCRKAERKWKSDKLQADSMSLNDFACVYWSYSENDWIADGCTKHESTIGSAVCSCKNQQKANFAILMAYDINYKYFEALHWISITGCALSVLGLSATALYQIKTRKARGASPTLLVVNICLSMMVFYLLFVFGINNPVQCKNVAKMSDQNKILKCDKHNCKDRGPCTAFTALLQYFLLATFTWNTLYGINVFMLFQNSVSGTPRWFSKVSMAVGWGLPAVIVGISLASTYRVEDPLGYRQEEFCWLASVDHKQRFHIMKPMFWGFVLPLLIMLITNTAILLHFSYNICKTNPKLNRSRTTPLKKKLLSSFSLAVMLGLSWLTGYILLITQEKTVKLILSVVFCLLTTTQSLTTPYLKTANTSPHSKRSWPKCGLKLALLASCRQWHDPFSQSWAMCGNDGTVWITANNMRADCWWEESGPDQSSHHVAQIRHLT
ncbi:hypothetical protein QQF64_018894 [Cirrhinus molitorella]|uniref:G-protein coupled receptors family 2 profile 2 domain-containing protein n=1 Tax=Cirrhinus molitorella TaxID=172907 RepID=A0ABR3LDZ6_9TELE